MHNQPTQERMLMQKYKRIIITNILWEIHIYFHNHNNFHKNFNLRFLTLFIKPRCNLIQF